MTQRTCTIDGCEKPVRAKAMCARHYNNLNRYGNAMSQRERPLGTRLLEVGWDVTEADCWEWRGKRNGAGYGVFTAARLGLDNARAHRVMYELHVGPIPEQHVIRHKCDNPPCVNPDHLETGTKSENQQDMAERGRSPHLWERNGNRCRNGHDVSLPGAVMLAKRGTPDEHRACVACDRARKTRHEARRATA